MTTIEQKFARVVKAFSQDRGVAVGEGKGFGSGALKINGKIFAMLSSGDQFVVKLPRKRVDELVASGTGVRFEPRPAKAMKEWFTVKASGVDWTELAREARQFVMRGKNFRTSTRSSIGRSKKQSKER
jgi:hypothetical protein